MASPGPNFWYTSTANAFNTTLNGNIGSGDVSITLNSTTNLNPNGGVLVVDRLDQNNNPDLVHREYMAFTGVAGNNITGVLRGLGGSTQQSHNSGAKVEEVFSITHWNDLISVLLGVFTSVGILDTTKVVDLTTAQILTNKDLTSITNTFPVNVPNPASPTQGDMLYWNGSAWAKLAATTSGYLLQTNGASTNPTWVAPSAGTTDGWTTSADTWTYVSASSFKITGVDSTTTFTKGTRLKFTNNSIIVYGVVASSSFSSDTTVTLFANNDYSINNSAITLPFYSYQINPQGYPGWFAYTPTFGGTGSMTYSPSINIARFSVVGKHCLCHVEPVNATTGGTPDIGLTFTTPVTMVNQSTDGPSVGCFTVDSTGIAGYANNVNGTTVQVRRYDSVNYGTGSNRRFSVMYPFEF